MQEFAKSFYKSQAWKKTRDAYAKSKSGLCEICLASGMYVHGEIVHHKIHLSPENIYDYSISLDWNNLQLVCRECHAAIHDKRKGRYRFDETGRLVVL